MSVPVEVAITTSAFYAAWVVAVTVVYLKARREREPGRWTDWNTRLWREWKAAAVLALLFFLASAVRSQFNPIAVGVFCQAMIGLATARSIPGFEPLPVVRAIREHRHLVRTLVLMAVIGVAANLAAKAVGGLGLGAGSVFGEHDYTPQLAGSFQVNAFQALFVLLGGAGVAEEVTFRLVGLTVVWKLTGRAWMAVVAGAVLFATYHFTPLDGLYRSFWQFPVGALVSNVLVGAVWGIVYVKRGLETAIVGHTLLDWLTFLVFVR